MPTRSPTGSDIRTFAFEAAFEERFEAVEDAASDMADDATRRGRISVLDRCR